MRKKNLAKRITAIALASAMSISLPGIENIPYMYDSSSVVQAAESTEIVTNWEFNDGVQDWAKEESNQFVSSASWDENLQALKMDINFSQAQNLWSSASINYTNFGNGLDISSYNSFSFDLYYSDLNEEDTDLYIVVSAKGDDNNESKLCEDEGYNISALTKTDKNNLKMVTFESTIAEEMKTKNLKELKISIKNSKGNFAGSIYIDNIRFNKSNSNIPSDEIITNWEFNDGVQDWAKEESNQFVSSASWDENLQALKMDINFSQAQNLWSSASINYTNFGNGLDISSYNSFSFDLYYSDLNEEDTDLYIAVSAKGDDNNESKLCEDEGYNISALTKTDKNNLKMVTFESTIAEEMKTKNLKELKISIKNSKGNFVGSIYIDNIKFNKQASTNPDTPPSPTETLKPLYEFTNGLEGWKRDDGYSSLTDGLKMDVKNENEMLKMSVDYSKATAGWRNAAIYFSNTDGSRLDFTPYNYLSFDLYYDDTKKTKGELIASIDVKDDNGQLSVGTEFNLEKVVLKNIGNQKMANLGFALNQNLASTVKPDKINIIIKGNNTDYNGNIYIDNIRFIKVEPETFKNWDFAQGIGNWKYNNIDWKDGDVNFNGSVEYDSAGQRLQTNVDFSQLSEDTWAQAGGISYSNEGGLSFKGKNQLSFDFYYPASLSGNITIKPVAEYKKDDKTKNLFVGNQSQSISGLVSEDAGNGLKKATFEFVLDENNTEEALPNQLLLVLIGNSTNYKGAVYFDNIKVETIDRGYIYSKIQPDENKTTLSTTDKVLTINDETKTYIDNIKLVDDKANDETKALYQYLKAIGESSSVIYGHMEDTVLKAGNDSDEFEDSDTADVTGSISAIDGLDCGALFDGFAKKYVDRYGENNSEGVIVTDNTFEDDVKAAAAFSNKSIGRGAIMTLSSHLPNFAHAKLKSNADSFTKAYDKYDYTGGDSYKLTGDCMNNILPGGKFNDAYTSYLDLIAEYAGQVNGPILFRPLHENTGSWFWWGKAFCDAETYKSVFKYTVDYLRDEKNVHNFLYLYGPGSEAASEEEYEERYPGDNYVDMVGFDSYDAKPTNDEKYVFMKNFENTVKLTNSFAQKHNKLFAVTETGISNDSLGLLSKDNPRQDWYKEILDIVTKADYNCCYFMLWSNYSSTSSYYTPFVVKKDEASARLYGHELLDKFIEFFNDKRTIFACHQEEIIKNFTKITKPIVAAKELDGYIIEPVANSRILNETTISAKFNMETDKTILIRASGNEKNIELKTVKDATGKVYTATLTKENLNALGKTADGKIGLYVDGKLYQEISVILNIEEKVMLPEQVDDFESYGGLANLLLGKWATNKDSGCTVDFSLVNDLCYEGEYALKFAYNETKTGWAGATISKEADWSTYDALKFWVKPDGKNQKTVIQINASEGTYEAYLNLYPEYVNASTPLLVTLPFSEFKKNNGDVLTSEVLKNMSGFGLWVNAIGDSAAFANGEETVSGELYYDDIRAVSAGTNKPIFEIAEGKKPEDTTTEVKENETEIKNNIGEASLSKTDFKNIQEDIKKDIVTALKDMLNNASTEDKEKAQKAIDAIESGQAFIDISLKVNEKSSGITDEDEKKENNIQIEDIRNEVQRNNNGSDVEVKVAVTLDISLFSICKDKKDNTEIARVALSKLTKPVKISMKLPTNIPVVKNGAVRTYYIICLHKNENGKIESSKVKCDYDKDNNMISFDGSKFSTYVLCYADVTPKSANNPSSGGSTGGSTISGGGTSVVLGSVTSTPVPTATPTAKPGTAASPVPSVTVTPTPVPSSTPSATNAPSVTGKPSQTEQPSDEPGTSQSKVKKGTKFITKGITYRVTSVSGTKTVTCVSGKKNIKKAVVPVSVKINGKKYKVTVIAKNAFKDNKKLTKVTIGKNVQSIGKNAFKGCKNLKKIVVKTKKLTAKKVGSNAFKGINSKAVVKVPKNKVKAYKKIIKAKGAGKKVEVTK